MHAPSKIVDVDTSVTVAVGTVVAVKSVVVLVTVEMELKVVVVVYFPTTLEHSEAPWDEGNALSSSFSAADTQGAVHELW